MGRATAGEDGCSPPPVDGGPPPPGDGRRLSAPHSALSCGSLLPQHESLGSAGTPARDQQTSLPMEPKFEMLYKIEDVPPWYLCTLLGFQVGCVFSRPPRPYITRPPPAPFPYCKPSWITRSFQAREGKKGSAVSATKQKCQRRLSGQGGLWVAYAGQEGPVHGSHGEGGMVVWAWERG